MAPRKKGDATAMTACHSGQTALPARLLERFAARAAAEGGGNLIFSPLSIHVALVLMSAGAAAGSALDKILAVAGAPSREALTEFVARAVVERVLTDRSGDGGPCVQRESTADGEFHRLDGSSVEVPFMQNWSYQLIACHDGFKALKLPYKAMDDVASSARLTWEQLQHVPRFSSCRSTGLPGEWRRWGPVYVDDVIHKAVVDVNEEGSEAAAATESHDDMGFSLYDEYVPPKPVDFVADHPFAFFIVEETSGAIIFGGQVLDASKEE